MSQRELLTFHLLFDLDHEEDPLKRFMLVLRWYMSLVRTETMEKKPYNPVIGEYHIAWVLNNGTRRPPLLFFLLPFLTASSNSPSPPACHTPQK